MLAAAASLLVACTPGPAVEPQQSVTAVMAPTAGATVSTPRSTGSTGARIPAAVSAPPAAGTAQALLETLPVKGHAPKTGYSRAQFGQAWTDDVSVNGGHNGCDTRNDVLRRDLITSTLKPGTRGCTVTAGTLRDPYSGRIVDFVRGQTTSSQVQIDHVVALSNAWQTGAQALSPLARRNLAEDPLELLAVTGSLNEAKGDGDAATWLPPDKAFRCDYVARQVAVKSKYRLWVTPAERTQMASVLSSCPGQLVPTGPSTDVPAPATG
jgi:hypothetical protein